MFTGIYRSKPVALFLTVLMVFFVCQTAYPQGTSANEKKADKALTEGLDLYKAGEYVKAIERFSQVIVLSKDTGKLSDSYFYLSLCNYFLGETDGAEEWAVKSLELDPAREASEIYPAGYIELFKRAKRTAGIELDKKRRAESRATAPKTVEPARAPVEEPRTPVVQRSREKEGGGHGGLYLILGLLAVGGAVAALLLLKGDKDDGGGDDDGDDEPTLGSIQVNSTPSGARVYLDGTDKGTTPLTISNVSVGSHTVKLTKEGYRDHQETVNVVGGQTTTVNATMSKHTISVTRPVAGALWMKGKDVEIRWTTDTSATLGNAFALKPGFGAAVSPTRWAAGIGSAAGATRAAGRGERSTRRGAGEGAPGGTAGEAAEFGPAREMRSPRLDSLARIAARGTQGSPDTSQARLMIISNVKIELYKGTEQVETIVSSTANDGSFKWEVREGLTNAKNYKIRVSCAEDSSVYGQSDAFEISDGYGKIKVTSTPAGAKIFLNGKATGKVTTATLEDVPAGTHTVKVEKTGYDTEEQTVTVAANKTVNVTFTLKGYGKIQVKANTPGAKVYLDGADTGKTTSCLLDRVVAGSHSVRLEKTGWETQEKSVTVVAGKTVTVNFVLEGIGKIHVTSTPSGATVYLDDVNTGQTTECTLNDVAKGSHTVRVEKDGYESAEKTVTVGAGATANVNFILAKTSIEVDKPDWWSIWGKGKEVEIRWVSGGTAAGGTGLRTERELRNRVPSLRNPLRADGAGRFAADARRGDDGAAFAAPALRPDLTVAAVVRGAGGAGGPKPPSITNVKIDLYKGSAHVTTIVETTPNDGLYTWLVDEALVDGVDYKVIVSDAGGSGATGESMTFALTDVTYEYSGSWGSTGSGNGQFVMPYGICTDKYPYVYVADTNNHRVQKFNKTGGWIRKWGSYGTLNGQFKYPSGIAADANQRIFVTDYQNNRIQSFDQFGNYITKWGSTGSGSGQFSGPYYLDCDSYGYVYVVDYNNHRVQKFWQTGLYIRKWGSYGTGNGQFSYPTGIAIDSSNTVYVVDRGNRRVQVFNSSGDFLSKFGSSGSGNGEFNTPYQAACDSYGFIYVADTGNDRIQKFSPRGIYCCKWGSSGSGLGQFLQPTDLALDMNGNVYVVDNSANRVQIFK